MGLLRAAVLAVHGECAIAVIDGDPCVLNIRGVGGGQVLTAHGRSVERALLLAARTWHSRVYGAAVRMPAVLALRDHLRTVKPKPKAKVKQAKPRRPRALGSDHWLHPSKNRDAVRPGVVWHHRLSFKVLSYTIVAVDPSYSYEQSLCSQLRKWVEVIDSRSGDRIQVRVSTLKDRYIPA
jgi:hypothetical protein